KPPLLESITVKIDNLDGQRMNKEAVQPAPQGDNVGSKEPAIEPQRRSERTPKKKSFPDSIVYSAIAMKAVHLEGNNSLGALITPFELVSEEEAMKEDAPAWLEAIKAELKSIKEVKTYSVVRELPKGRTAIGCKWVLRRKFNVESTAQSTMEAEFVAASEASREIAWLEKLWKDI